MEVADGEDGEITLLQVRGKLYSLAKDSKTWKERGAGNLRINAPHSSHDADEQGEPIPGSFDPSSLDIAESKAVRLVMRQDATHKLILNTVVIPSMKFEHKETKGNVAYILFTAIEGDGDATPMQLKVYFHLLPR